MRAEDVHLATMRVYTPPPGTPGAKSRFVLFLPPNKNPNSGQESNASSTPPPPPSQHSNRPTFNFATSYITTGPEPDCYELDMVNEAVENQIVVAERPKDASLSVHGSSVPYNSRARTTILTGRIKHECNLRPSFSETYRNQLRRRHLMHNIKSRQIKRIEETGVPRGGINRLSSGVGVGGGGAFSDLVVCILPFCLFRPVHWRRLQKTKSKPQKGFERMARIPRNQLLDQLFSHFRDTPHWGLRPLRDRTQQPEVYLKEVLSEIAFLHRSGEHNGMWELKDNFKDENVRDIRFYNSFWSTYISDFRSRLRMFLLAIYESHWVLRWNLTRIMMKMMMMMTWKKSHDFDFVSCFFLMWFHNRSIHNFMHALKYLQRYPYVLHLIYVTQMQFSCLSIL